MNVKDRIHLLGKLGAKLADPDNRKIETAITKAHHENQWFTPENSRKSLNTICTEYLDERKLKSWSEKYNLTGTGQKNIGLVLAGNLPLVGFHDVLCSFVTGNRSIIKTSSKDASLIKMIINELVEIHPDAADYFKIVDRLSEYDAVIATGSNNTAKHFEYYFKNHPNIIRRNRTSIAILSGQESKKELYNLGSDVFDYFGLGCRNVSKLYVPEGYNLEQIFEAFFDFQSIIDHHKYKNNYDYNEAIWLLGLEKFLTNSFIILKEEKSLHSRIASLYYEYYDDINDVQKSIKINQEQIQCISTNMDLEQCETVILGQCQYPTLSDYADGVDTMAFLCNLSI